MKRILGWSLLVFVTSLLVLLIYCIALFRELEPLMADSPSTKPSILYSDYFSLKKETPYLNSFLKERLNDLRISPTENKTDENKFSLKWTEPGFDHPASILESLEFKPVEKGKTIEVFVEKDLIDHIEVEGDKVDGISLNPTAIAQVLGTTRSLRDFTRLPDVPTKLLEAIIAIEDQRFLEHSGFDPRSFLRAVVVNIRSRSLSQGGSTLTQQLVKNLLQTRQKTFFRKIRELILAFLMEARYSKDFILEKYLNEVYFGQVGSLEVHGVAEASRLFYNKPLNRLSLAEMALIAGVIRGPAVYSPYKHSQKALERKNTVLKKMQELDLITSDELKFALNQEIKFATPSQVNNKAPYFSDFVKYQILEQLGEQITEEDLTAGGLRIFTTADLMLQKRADQAVLSGVKDLEARYKLSKESNSRIEGLIVVAEHKSGKLRAIVGGRSYSDTTFNRVINMKRQVGSTFKPITYLSAFLKGEDSSGKKYSGAYMVEDEPWKYVLPKSLNPKKQSWSPKNYEKSFRGHITLREAFANSINIPMAKIGVDVGIPKVIETAHKLGIKSNIPQVASISLGVAELGPIELLQVYSTFANDGNNVELTAVQLIQNDEGKILARFAPHSEQVIAKPVIQVLNDLLRSVVQEGTAKSLPQLGYSKPARGKTGTTNFSRDAWFAGFSENLSAVSWAGFEDLKLPEATDDSDEDEATLAKFKSPALLTGAGAALPMWARFFANAKPSPVQEIAEPPEFDSSISLQKIDKSTGLLAKPSCPENLVYKELFLPGTSPSLECNVH